MRIACVDIPALPLQLLLRRHPEWREHPAAVVDEDRSQGLIRWVNRSARKYGILPGLRYGSALSLARELRAGVISDEEIHGATQQLHRRLDFYSAGIEPSAEPGVFWIDADGLSLLHPSLRRWAHEIREALGNDGWHAAIAVGFSRLRCYALAKAGRPPELVLRTPEEEERRARAVPLARLDFDPKLRDTLAKLGVHDLGAFVDLPGDGVRRRFGAQMHRIHQLARDELWSPLQAQVLSEPVAGSHRFDHGENDLDRLLHALDALSSELFSQLRVRRQLLQKLELTLRLEDGHRERHELQPAQPTLDAKILLQLLRLRLERTRENWSRPVEELRLLLQGVAAGRDQPDLFPDTPGRDPDAAARAFARLRAEFGEDVVRRASLREGHLPQGRFQLERFDAMPRPRPGSLPPEQAERRPLVRRVSDRPLPLSRQRRNEPDGWMIAGLDGGAAEEVYGPYVVSGGWWTRERTREYHFVRTPRAGWLWVYFDRGQRRWLLEGTVE